MSVNDLEAQISALWEHRDDPTPVMSEAEAAVAVRATIDLLDRGEVRVAERVGDDVVVHAWLKQAILLLFRLTHMETMELAPFEYRDKIPLKQHYEAAGVRVVPGPRHQHEGLGRRVDAIEIAPRDLGRGEQVLGAVHEEHRHLEARAEPRQVDRAGHALALAPHELQV